MNWRDVKLDRDYYFLYHYYDDTILMKVRFEKVHSYRIKRVKTIKSLFATGKNEKYFWVERMSEIYSDLETATKAWKSKCKKILKEKLERINDSRRQLQDEWKEYNRLEKRIK